MGWICRTCGRVYDLEWDTTKPCERCGSRLYKERSWTDLHWAEQTLLLVGGAVLIVIGAAAVIERLL